MKLSNWINYLLLMRFYNPVGHYTTLANAMGIVDSQWWFTRFKVRIILIIGGVFNALCRMCDKMILLIGILMAVLNEIKNRPLVTNEQT